LITSIKRSNMLAVSEVTKIYDEKWVALEEVSFSAQKGEFIKLVGPSFKRKKKVTIIQADAFTWKPNGQKFDWGWHDIWTDLCVDILPEMTKLKRHYCRAVTVGQQRCWDEDRLKRLSRRGGW